MLTALLKGKLSRDQENMEDILTSNVFGLFKYLPPEKALLPFLSKAATFNGTNPLAFPYANGLKVKYKFWPWLEELGCIGCEPDVLIRMTWPDGEKMIILIEAKYRSGKSSWEKDGNSPDDSLAPEDIKPPIDQLAREWDNLTRIAEREDAKPVLIYLTAHVGYPTQDIRSSQDALLSRGHKGINIYWLSWRRLPSLIEGKACDMLDDLAAVLRRLDLTFFEGIKPIMPKTVRWSFSVKPMVLDWLFPRQKIAWGFIHSQKIDWRDFKVQTLKWGFQQ